MRKLLFFIFYYSLIINCFGQNLIKNPSFEDTTKNNTWSTGTSHCYKSALNICSKNDDKKSTEYISFNSSDGNNCVYLSLFQCETKWSEYLISKIVKIEKGKRYTLSFFITPNDSGGYYIKFIDVLFCNSSTFYKNISCLTPGKIYLNPTISFDISSFKKTGQEGKWLKLSGTFIANGDEDMMVVGNFFNHGKARNYVSARIFNYKTSKKFLIENFCSADYYLDNFSLNEK